MLILKRKPGESLRIGENITISILGIENGRVRISIDAPTDIPILRSELLAAISANQDSVAESSPTGEFLKLLESVLEHRTIQRKE